MPPSNQKDRLLGNSFMITPINSSDAYILQCALDKSNQLRTTGHDLILVSSDKSLLNAARSEGLLTFDPETDSQTTLNVLINSS